MKIKTLLVAQDDLTISEVQNLLALYPTFAVASICHTASEAMNYITHEPVDLLFSAIDLGGPAVSSDGSWLVFAAQQQLPDLLSVLYSADRSDAYYAYRYGSTGFLTTPFDPLAAQSLFTRLTYLFDLLQYKREAQNRSIMVRTRNGYQLAQLSNILFIERTGRRTEIVMADGKQIPITGYSLDELEKMLEHDGFYRCYQSFIVNLSRISFVRADTEKRNYAILFDGYGGEIVLSREKYSEILGLLKNKFTKLSI